MLRKKINKKLIYTVIFMKIAVFLFVLFLFNYTKEIYGISPDITQVKTINKETVYYLDHKTGFKKPYLNGKVFLSYDNKWSDIKIISQEELNKWANAYLIKTKESLAIYYIKNNKKAKVNNPEEFTKHGFRWKDVIVVNKIDLDSYADIKLDLLYGQVLGIKISDEDEDEEEGGRNARINITVDSEVPKNLNIPFNTKDNLVGVFNFQTDSGSSKIKIMTVYLKGIFNSSIIDNVYLQDLGNVDYKVKASLNGKKAVFNFNSNPLVVPSYAKKIGVYVDLRSTEIIDRGDLLVYLDKKNISTDSEIKSEDILEYHKFNLINASDGLGRVVIEQLAIANTREALVGTNDYLLAKYKISEISNNEDVILKEVVFKNNGSTRNNEVTNIKLKNKQNRVISQVDSLDNREIKFIINDHLITKNSSDWLEVYGDISSGKGTSVKLEIEDIKVVGVEHEYGLFPIVTKNIENVSIINNGLGVLAQNLEVNRNVFKNKQGSLLGVFKVINNNQNINLEEVEISLVKDDADSNLVNPIYVVNYQTGEVYDYVDSGSLGSGGVSLNLLETALKAKAELTLAFVSQMADTISNGARYKIVVNKIKYSTSDDDYYVDEVNSEGRILVINKSSLSIFPNDALKDIVYIKGKRKVKIASFFIESSATESINITSFTLGHGNTSGFVNYVNGFSNLIVYLGGKKIGVIEKPSSHSYFFDGFGYRLRPDKRVEIKVYANLDEDLKISETQLMITNVVAAGYESNIKTNVSGLNTASNKVSFGEVKISVDTLSGGSVIIGRDDNVVTRFKIKNTGNEQVRLKYVTVNTFSVTDNYKMVSSNGFTNLRITVLGLFKKLGTKYRPSSGSSKISLRSYRLEPNAEIVLDVLVDAKDDAEVGNYKLYLSDLIATGDKSKIEAKIEGSYNTVDVSVK